jgi:hypothetical protein
MTWLLHGSPRNTRCSPRETPYFLAFFHVPPHISPCQTAGRPLPSGRGKSGLHGNTVPANGRRGRPQGKCHRKQTARARAARHPAGKGETVRQKRTAPLATGAAGQTPPGARPNRGGGAARHRSLPAPPPGLVACGAPQGASQRNGRPALRCGQNPAYRPSGTVIPLRRIVPRFIHRERNRNQSRVITCPSLDSHRQNRPFSLSS